MKLQSTSLLAAMLLASSQVMAAEKQKILLPNDWGHRYEACGRALAPLHRQSPIELPSHDALVDEYVDSVLHLDILQAFRSMVPSCTSSRIVGYSFILSCSRVMFQLSL